MPLRLSPKIDSYPKEWLDKPFFRLSAEMLECVSDHNYERLSKICDDDFGIIDINPEGGSEIIRDRAGWEAWFTGLFAKLQTMQADTWSEITGYECLATDAMAYSVVDFDQILAFDSKEMRFSVIATIIWKKQDGEWKESRYHSSLLSVTGA